jgi:hypothetical protein
MTVDTVTLDTRTVSVSVSVNTVAEGGTAR